MGSAKVFFTPDITPEAVIRAYEALGIELSGKVAVKLHSGEVGNQNFIGPTFLKPMIDYVNGTIVEANTAYPGKRNTTAKHLETVQKHGWVDIAEVDILDETDELELPIPDGVHIKKTFVGAHLQLYDSMLVLSHFKGHPMGGYGGALKNISIGVASSHGKAYIHGAGCPAKKWVTEKDKFLGSMADAAKALVDFFPPGKIAYINIMKNMSVDCDCCAVAEDPQIADIGILSSLDPVGLDQACIDLVYNSDDPGKDHLIKRIESKNGIHTIACAADLNVGSRKYELIQI